ncbi:hypothetical protein [Thiohalomonas denitrificans]|uniref:hypothetical protein n=1 Tax=Thiohalomonas denitrificans TaxID=415747 RepID=UPI0026F2AA1A|nr:hypothetical protein [Thiohalomonas denitrificans]
MNEFLKIEYEQCLSLIKYYDERHQSLVKFCAGLSSAVPSLLLTIFQLGDQAATHFWEFTALISGVTTLGLLSVYTVLVQTRLYFIYPVRQVNAIRRVGLDSQTEFTNNQMYLNTTFSAFKWSSSHTLLNGFVALQIGAFSSLSTYSLYADSTKPDCAVITAAGIGLFLSLLVFGISAWYLHAKSKQSPDKSIHGRGKEE